MLSEEMAANVYKIVSDAVMSTPVTDIHTHLYPPSFDDLFLWGIDDLLTYHYLIAEAMHWSDMSYDRFWALNKRQQADFIWQTLFIDRSPLSEACQGVLTVIERLGLDPSTKDLNSYRAYFETLDRSVYVNQVFELAGIESVIMTNDPFDEIENPMWTSAGIGDDRFRPALRLDRLLNSWEVACISLRRWGYIVEPGFEGKTLSEVRRFLKDWIIKIIPLYMAVSLPASFKYPDNRSRSRLITECVLPVAAEFNLPFAMMIGVKRGVNSRLRLAGDSVAKADIESIEYMCANYPDNKFMVTMLSRENQHELCVTARKFRNLLIFGCWWFLNTPLFIDEITRMRVELLGTAFVPQHSDARVLDQLIYKWYHSRIAIADVLIEKYLDMASTGWVVSKDDVERDLAELFGGTFRKFVSQ